MAGVPEWDLTPKRVRDSRVTLVQVMELADVNPAGIVHGGTIMRLVDQAAAVAAIRHCGGVVVTASVDEMSFLHPVHIGDIVTVRASVNDVGRTSMEVGVRVEAEDVVTGQRTHTSSAYVVLVALDREGRPRPVPPLVVETGDEARRQREARIRRQTRLAHREAIRAARAEASGSPTGGG